MPKDSIYNNYLSVRRLILRLILPTFILGIWELAVYLNWFPPSVSASPTDIIVAAKRLIIEDNLLWHTTLSMLRLTIGSVFGIFSGLALGLAAVMSRSVETFLSPTIRFIAPIPAVVWLPFAVMIFGTGEVYKAFLPFFITFLLVYIQTLQGAKSISNNYFEVAKIYEKTRLEIVKKILLPAILPSVLTGVKVALAIGWIAIFIVEFSSADPDRGGLGWFIADAREVGRVEDQFAATLVLGIIGFATDSLVNLFQKRKSKWAKPISV